MKKAILIVLMALLLVIPAYAVEGDPAIDQPIQQEQETVQEPVIVATLEELQAAIDAAEDGDTIYISHVICVNDGNSIECDKQVTLARAEQFAGNEAMITIWQGGKISGLTFFEESDKSNKNTLTISVDNTWALPAIIQNCKFSGDNTYSGNFITVLGGIEDENLAQITDCNFSSCGYSAVSTKANTDVSLTGCSFSQNKTIYQGGAICNSGKMLLEDCEIEENSAVSGGGVFNSGSGKMTIKNCYIHGNTIEVPLYGTDIFSFGTITITGTLRNDMYLYDEATGEKQLLPVEIDEEKVTLICLSDEEATEYFIPEPPLNEEVNPPAPGDQDNAAGNKQPSEGDMGNSSTEAGPLQDNSDGDPSQNTENQTEPPRGNTTDGPADTTIDTSQPLQKPSDGDNGGNDTPSSTDYRPSRRPAKPSVTIEQSKPQEQPNVATPEKLQLDCNGATIDTTRTAVLLGYGDGQLHETDTLTRAQLAAIIYRLLDDDSIALYGNAELTFSDVAADAWFAPYIRIMRAAGIINGVGDGKYDPNGKVTWAQTITILSRFVEAQEVELQNIQYDGWATLALKTAVALGWIKDRATFNPYSLISRGELVQFINNVLILYR